MFERMYLLNEWRIFYLVHTSLLSSRLFLKFNFIWLSSNKENKTAISTKLMWTDEFHIAKSTSLPIFLKLGSITSITTHPVRQWRILFFTLYLSKSFLKSPISVPCVFSGLLLHRDAVRVQGNNKWETECKMWGTYKDYLTSLYLWQNEHEVKLTMPCS